MRNLLAAEQNATQLRRGILEREIHMAGRLRPQIGDLARHPDLADRFFQQPLDLIRQFADRQHAPRLLRWKQFTEVPLRFGFGHSFLTKV